MYIFRIIFICFLLFSNSFLFAQEFTAPLMENKEISRLSVLKKNTQQRPTAITLPFFEDFVNEGPFPNPDLWNDKSVYVNNHFGKNLISKGCATFDGLDKNGVPYDSLNPYFQVYADSLTSQQIDLSSLQISDSLYLSFYYQPGGHGFLPKETDSLMLYFRKESGSWTKVWSIAEHTYQDFRSVILLLNDSSFFHDHFQFRFVNKATMGIGNSQWNIDYILLDKNRNFQDTEIEDIAFTDQPENLLSDYTSMPFDHFKTDPTSFLKGSFKIPFRNNGFQSGNIDFSLKTQETLTTQTIGSMQQSSLFFNPNETKEIDFNTPSIGNFNPTEERNKYIFRQTFSTTSIYPGESKGNDTFTAFQIFDNYLSYDDGTAEKAYYLNLFPNAPGETAVKYALYRPDTIGGVSIYFPRQVPTGINKEFSFAIYKTIAVNGQQEELMYQENFLFPEYQEGQNGFSNYVFSEPVIMPAGDFYVSIIQAAGGTSDLLYMGLDRNRASDNHRYFNVEGHWVSSEMDGALMMRPLIGTDISTDIPDINNKIADLKIVPNPAGQHISILSQDLIHDPLAYKILDVQGRVVLEGETAVNKKISVSSLNPGMYFIHVFNKDAAVNIQKLLKI